MFDYTWHSIGPTEEKTQEYVCAHCNKTVAGFKHNTIVFHGIFPGYGTTHEDAYHILECPSCNLPTIFKVGDGKTYPYSKVLMPVKHLSENLNDIYEEIRNAIGSGCYTSAVILQRQRSNYA